MSLSISLSTNSLIRPICDHFFRINPSLENRITNIARQAIHSELSDQQIADLKYGFKLAHSRSWSAGQMKKLLSTLPKETMKEFIFKLMADGDSKEIDYYFQICLSLLNENLLLNLSGFNTEEMAAATFKSKALTKSTATNRGLEKEARAISKEFIIESKYFIHQFLEVLLAILGIDDVTRQKRNRFKDYGGPYAAMEARSKMDTYWKLLTYPAAIFALIYSYIQYKSTALILTSVATIASITALVAYNRYWKPCPIDYPGLANLTVDLLRENNPIYPRRDILKKIEEAFQAKKGVILVGKPGSGKSWIARSLAEQISLGKVCSFMKDANVFTCNGTRLKKGGYDVVNLPDVEECFKRHRNKAVFFFDEFHSLFKIEGLYGTACDDIKTFCQDFKYVIGATTIQEYEAYIKNQSMIVDRRFKIIHVDTMADEQIKTFISYYLESSNTKIAFDPTVIDYIIEKANVFNANTSTIDAAHSLLNLGIQKMSSVAHTKLEEQKICLEDQLGVMEQHLINLENPPNIHELTELLLAKKAELTVAAKELQDINLRTQRMQKMESYRLNLKKKSYNLAQPGVNLIIGSAQARDWSELHARIKIAGEFIAKEREALELPRCLDQTLIDKILSEK